MTTQQNQSRIFDKAKEVWPDFARGGRSDPDILVAPNDDYARGLRTQAKDPTIRPDYAQGERQIPQDITIRSNFARSERIE